MDNFGIEGRTALVTGGESGIGAAVAITLRGAGARVLTLDLASTSDVVVDLADVNAVVDALSQLERVDILVNSAGIVGPNAVLSEVSPEDWDRTFAVNTRGTFLTCKCVVPGMIRQGWGRIVNIASIAGKEGNPNLSAYSASKAAVIALTKTLGKEMASLGVLVNAIAPAVIETPMNAATDEAVLRSLVEKIPMARAGQAAEVAELVLWLASERCSFSTGAVFDCSGGRATY
jgi:3-oxoacyl-[acyl-carrier protein] reductase